MEKLADARVQRPCQACGRILSISFIRDKGSNTLRMRTGIRVCCRLEKRAARPRTPSIDPALKPLGFGRSPIFALTPVPAATSLPEAALEVGCRATKRALSDDGLTVLKHRYFFPIYDKRLVGTARFASEYVAGHCGKNSSIRDRKAWSLEFLR
jgi:hypothetical protein